MNYSIENLEVYRRAVNLSASILMHHEKVKSTTTTRRLDKYAHAATEALAVGLGTWEREVKAEQFRLCKSELLRVLALLEVERSLERIHEKDFDILNGYVRDLIKMVAGLLRGATRRGGEDETEGQSPG